MSINLLRDFLRLESAAGIVLMLAAAAALVCSNSPLAALYDGLLGTHVSVLINGYGIDKPLLLWINDGLMAVFFLLVGLEIKREILEGQLSSRDQIVLPAVGAAGGFVLPALIYAAINWHDSGALNGWAIPTATDIAFALGVLALLGRRVPPALIIFLTSLAIFDDVAAIVVIALFYTADLTLPALLLAGGGLCVLLILNRCRIRSITPYALIGLVVWVGVLKSGVHATLAGLVVAMCIPLAADQQGHSPLHWLERTLHPWVAYLVLPVFAFANAGIPLRGIDAAALFGGIPLGIAAGLFFGKQFGVFCSCWMLIRLGGARLSQGANWASFYGVAVIAGIGFTMSLFIGNLAFEHGGFDDLAATRVGVLIGSLCSALLGAAVLWLAGGAAARESQSSV